MKYKYTIYHKLYNLSYSDYEIAMKFFPETLKIHKETFRRWIFIPADSAAEIPGTYLLKIANFFECQPKELLSDPKPIDGYRDKWVDFKRDYVQDPMIDFNPHDNV